MLWIIEKWSAAHDNRPFTTCEVAEWAMANGLLDEDGDHMCVHCGCSDSEGCSTRCWWVDFDETVCSKCLIKSIADFAGGGLIDVGEAFELLAIDHGTPALAAMQQAYLLPTILALMPADTPVRGWCQNCQRGGPVHLVDQQWCEKCAPGCRKARDRKRRKESTR